MRMIGASRVVHLCCGWAIKRPHLWPPRKLLLGIRANRAERRAWFSRQDYWWRDLLCHMVASDPVGLLVIMKRARMMTATEVREWRKQLDRLYEPGPPEEPFEDKEDEWGWLEGRPVAVDYARHAWLQRTVHDATG